jgi:lysophospholipase L1-like esterase
MVTVVAMGDSITYGQLLGPDEKRWAQLVGTAIQVAAVPGETTRMALERWPRDVQQVEPSIVVIQYGHNDANRWVTDRGLPRVSPGAFTANLREMIERCRAFDALPLLCTLTPVSRSNAFAEDVAHYDRLLRGVAKTESVQLIDVRSAFEEYPLADLLIDGLHLNPTGHAVFAGAAKRVLALAGAL